MSDQRAEFVALATQPGANRRRLCQRFGISAPTRIRFSAETITPEMMFRAMSCVPNAMPTDRPPMIATSTFRSKTTDVRAM